MTLERRTGLAAMSAKRRAELAAAGNTNPFSTIPNTRAGLSRTADGRDAKPRRQPADTGPDRGTVAMVVARDFVRCARCGDPVSGERGRDFSVQHRRARGLGGTVRSDANEPQNLILLHGSGTTSCHGHVETNREEARVNGWAIRQTDDPAEVPVNHAVHGWVLLTDAGTTTTYSPNHTNHTEVTVTIDVDAIRREVPFIRAHWSAIQDTPQPGLVTDRLICTQQSADDIPTVLRWVDGLTKEVEQLRPFETAVLHMLVLAGDEYRQAIVAARASVSGDDYAKNNARAEMIRVFATGLAERAGLPVTDWEQIKRAVPSDGVYRTEVKA